MKNNLSPLIPVRVQRRLTRRLRTRAFTLVDKLQQFQDLESEATPGRGISGIEGVKQSLMQFYFGR